MEREFSPEAIPRSSISAETSVNVVSPQDDLHQLLQEREMVRHRELEALSCKLMEKKHIPGELTHMSTQVFENDVE